MIRNLPLICYPNAGWRRSPRRLSQRTCCPCGRIYTATPPGTIRRTSRSLCWNRCRCRGHSPFSRRNDWIHIPQKDLHTDWEMAVSLEGEIVEFQLSCRRGNREFEKGSLSCGGEMSCRWDLREESMDLRSKWPWEREMQNPRWVRAELEKQDRKSPRREKL